MKKNFFATLIIVLIFSTLHGQSIKDQFERRTHAAYNKTIPYRLFIPENYSSSENYPLVLILHGSNERGSDNDKQLDWLGAVAWAEEEVQRNHPCFIMVPQCPSYQSWWSQYDIINQLFISLLDEFAIDSTRLYLSQYKWADNCRSDMILMTPIHFAAVIPVAGIGEEEVLPLVSYLPPIWNFHGVNDQDRDVQRTRDKIAILEEVLGIEGVYPVLRNGLPSGLTETELDSVLQTGPQLIYSETSDDHSTILDPAYTDPKVYDWMFSQKTDFILPVKSPSPKTTKSSNLSDVTTSSVFGSGTYGSWDGWSVSGLSIIKEGDTLKMWYVGWEEGWRLPTKVGFTWSLDGINWNRYSNNPVLSPDLTWEGTRLTQMSVIKDDNTYRMWYSAGDKTGFSTAIGYAWSEDGITWIKNPDPVLLPGELGEWDHYNIAVGTVVKEEGRFKMWYHGGTWMTGMQIGYATSMDGINWTKYDNSETEESPYQISDPVITTGQFPEDWDFHSVRNPIVYSGPQGYEMWYSGSTLGITGFLYYATSPDGINWYKSETNPVLADLPVWAKETGYVGGTVLKYADECHLWYGAYNYETRKISIGYAKDFSNIAHSDSLVINNVFFKAGVDTVDIKARAINPMGHGLELNAHIISNDFLIDYYIPLINEGDNIWRGYRVAPEEEKNYEVSIQTVDLDSGTVHYSIEVIKEYFTTIGPIKYDGFSPYILEDSVANPGDILSFKIYLKNEGQITRAEDIEARLYSNTPKIAIHNFYSTFGNITAGNTVESRHGYSLIISSDFSQDTTIYLTINISSEGYQYWSDSMAVPVIVTGISQKDQTIPKTFALAQNYPNPFNPRTMINYQLPTTITVDLSIYNLLGQKVAMLVSEKQNAGYHQAEWNASKFASGIYYYSIKAGEFLDVKKMILLR